MESALTSQRINLFGTSLTLGKVFNVSPEGNMVDVLLFNGTVLNDVQVMGSFASSRSGTVNLPDPKYFTEVLNKDKPLETARLGESDVIAVVAFLRDNLMLPIVLGFIFPETCEILCDRTQAGNEDGTQFLYKHPSNIYVRIAKGKDQEEGKTPELEISHPSGLFIRIGKDLVDEDSNPILREITNYDNNIRPFKKLNPDNGTADPAPTVRLYHPSGTTIFIDTDGSVSITVQKDVTTLIKGNVIEEIDGDVNRTIKGKLTETIEKDVSITMKQKFTEEVDGDVTRTVVNGTETDSIHGHWERDSDDSIKDAAPRIDHN